jgi:hypothetical protein
MRARMASDKNPYSMRDQGSALAENSMNVAEDEADPKR